MPLIPRRQRIALLLYILLALCRLSIRTSLCQSLSQEVRRLEQFQSTMSPAMVSSALNLHKQIISASHIPKSLKTTKLPDYASLTSQTSNKPIKLNVDVNDYLSKAINLATVEPLRAPSTTVLPPPDATNGGLVDDDSTEPQWPTSILNKNATSHSSFITSSTSQSSLSINATTIFDNSSSSVTQVTPGQSMTISVPITESTHLNPILAIADNSNSSFVSTTPEYSQTTLPTTTVITTQTSSTTHPLLIYSIRYEIRSFDLAVSPMTRQYSYLSSNSAVLDQHFGLKHSPSKTLIAGLKNTIGLDFYLSSHESYIFWIDVIEERIFRGTLVNGIIANVNMIVQGGLANAEGLAVDWIGKNIYWVESSLDHIEVANLNGSNRRTLVAGDMENPRAISVDPRYGFMFWTDWDRKSPRIERATMSGDDRRKLVDIKEVKGGWPNGLTLDYEALKIYWIDANSDSIHVVNYDGNNHKSLLSSIKSLGHPFAITLFDSNLYWTDWKTNFISTANKNNGSEAREVLRQQSRLFDIKVFHPRRQPRMLNSVSPCAVNNGNCSHLCLLSINNTRKCLCPHLMRLTADNMTCEPYERVLIIGKTHEIRAVDINEPLHHIMSPISVPKVFNPRQFEYDSKSKTIFWADSATNEVKRAQLSGGPIETIIDVIIDAPSGLALDWISGNIYVTSAAPMKAGKIFISNLNGEFMSILMDGNQGIVSPKSIVVHPLLGLLFCIDENKNSEPLIFVASMDGRNKRIIASKQFDSSLASPSNLAIDLESNRVYWVNQANSLSDNASIQYYDINLDEVITLYNEAEFPPDQRINPGVICVDGDNLIISSRTPNETIVKTSKSNITERIVYKTQSLDQIMALRVYNSSAQIGANACSIKNGGCSQLCIPIGLGQRTCKCTIGYNINSQNETECLGKDSFLIFSYNQGMKGIGLDPGASPDDYYLPPIHKAFRAFSIDYIHRDNLIYWVDNEEGSITRINRDTTNYQVIVQGLESEECIGIDWVAGNIYWLDPYYDIIEVARLNGSNRYTIISGDMDKANGIVVNPLKGYIVWSDMGTIPKIERARLDGTDRRVLVVLNLTHIDDLTIDHEEDFIYWVDSTSSVIERVKADGTQRQIVYKGQSNIQSIQHHLVSIAIHKEYLYVADSVYGMGSIILINKNNSSDTQTLQQNLGDGIRDITVFAEQSMPKPEKNPCVENNGGCQDLCLYLGEHGKRRCICAHGRLKSDGVTCQPFDTFIVYSKLSQIDSLHIQDDESHNNSPYSPISIESRSNIISLAIDNDAKRVIYSEMTRDQICSVLFNGTDRKVLVEKQSMVEGVTYANGQLYWTSIQDNSISRLNTSSSGVPLRTCNKTTCWSASVEKLVRLTADDKPRGIAVDSCTSYIYWTNWNNEASIQRASPSNGYKIESIIKTGIKVPNGIAIDQRRRKLYWCDARLDKIETCDMDGTNRVVLISALPQHPFALAVWKNYVFWTDWLARGVFKADKYTGQQAVQIKKVAQRPMGIAVASLDIHACPVDHCGINNGGCVAGLICVSREDDNGKPMISCHEPRQAASHDVLVPKLSMCSTQGGKRNCSDYKDILMDKFDRYKNTDPYDVKDGLNVVNISASIQPASQSAQPIVIRTSQQANLSPLPVRSTDFPQYKTTTHPPATLSTTLNSGTVQTTQLTPSSLSTNLTEPQVTTSPPCQAVTITPTHGTSTELPGPDCDRTHFKCYLSESLICIAGDKRCNGDYDCPSKEDESDCYLSSKGQYNLKQQEHNWHKYVTVILVILAAAIAAMSLVFGSCSKRRGWFVGSLNGFGHRKMFEDSGTNIEISNPMFDEDDSANLMHCAFSIDLNERTTNFSNPLYERQVLLVNDKNTPRPRQQT